MKKDFWQFKLTKPSELFLDIIEVEMMCGIFNTDFTSYNWGWIVGFICVVVLCNTNNYRGSKDAFAATKKIWDENLAAVKLQLHVLEQDHIVLH